MNLWVCISIKIFLTSCSASFARPRYVSRLVLHMLFDVMTATTTQTYNHASICHGFNQQRVAHKSSPNKLFLKRSAPYLHLQSEGWRCLGGLSAPSPSRRRNAKPKDTANNYENSAKTYRCTTTSEYTTLCRTNIRRHTGRFCR